MTRIKKIPTALTFLLALCAFSYAQRNYVPPAGSWERHDARAAGLDDAALKAAVEFAAASESKTPRDLLEAHYRTFGREPFGEPVGPFADRGPTTGLIVKDGYIVAAWGEPDRVDMTFSVTKSFLSAVVGVAFDGRLIRSLQDRASGYAAPITVYDPLQRYDSPGALGRPQFLDLFATPHNRTITWEHLLRQTSDWEGSLWGKPDWADRPDRDPSTWLTRARSASGTVYEYNDVRVNVMALAALNVLRRPLPEVLKKHVMDEIGASQTWRWHGYENSFVLLDGQVMQSVSGGGHWGGGMFINAYDMARFGLLTARSDKWGAKQVLSAEFVRQATTPTAAHPTYGFMNWHLNTERKLYPSAPEGIVSHLGNGTNMIYADPANDLVIVARWIENGKIDEFLAKVYAALADKK
jgi:CubicO group peptidase (beta-lactamase class C family)